MTIDDFDEISTKPFYGLSPSVLSTVVSGLNRFGQLLGVEVEGLEHLPKGRALIVANHPFGFDFAFAVAAIHSATGRNVWSLGEHAWWKVPFVRKLATNLGVVDGTRENADTLLQKDEMVLVLPGGLREAMKPSELRYRLLWGNRYGFIKTAIRNQAPLVPLASIGSEDLFTLVGNPYERGKRWLGNLGIPLPRPSWGLPIVHKVALKYILGEPVWPNAKPEQAEDMEVLKRTRHEVEGALQELIDNELARRAGFPMDGGKE